MNLQDLITGRIQLVEIPESLINQLLHDHGLNHTVQIRNNSIVLSADNIKAEVSYHSHNFNNGNITINFILNKIKPFYYSMGLQLIHKRYPYLLYWKDHIGNKMITCYLDRISGIDSVFNDYASYIKDLNIESIDYREGKIIIGLCTKSGGTEGDQEHV
ncbi:hypothetical protein BAC3_01233 [uncultured bacterium]|nr:hypothetical protein BAC3_01233 [uncultured bacterium]